MADLSVECSSCLENSDPCSRNIQVFPLRALRPPRLEDLKSQNFSRAPFWFPIVYFVTFFGKKCHQQVAESLEVKEKEKVFVK